MRQLSSLRLFSAFALLFSLLVPMAANAEAEISTKDFHVYCAYLEAIDKAPYNKMSSKRRDKKLAKKARMRVKTLKKHIAAASAYGDTCEEVGKKFEADTKAALKKELPGRIQFFMLDFSEPDHVVASVRFKAILKKDVVADAALVAWAVHEKAPIVRTSAIRGVDPQAADPESDDAVWFEGKISQTRAQQIRKKRIASFANTRYVRLFDGVVKN